MCHPQTNDSTDSLSAPLLDKNPKTKNTPYQVRLSPVFVVLFLIGSTLGALNLGKVTHDILSKRVEDNLEIPFWLKWAVQEKAASPIPAWIDCTENPEDSLCNIRIPTNDDSSSSSSSSSDSDSDDEDEDEDTASFGQHLLADVSPMDPESLVQSLLELALSKGWKLKSHSCTEAAVCVLVFHEGHHMVLHQPSHQLDIYSTDDEPLLPWLDSLPLIEKWAFKERGSHNDPLVFDAGVSDMNNGFLGSFQYASKRLVVKQQSPFQEVAIYDTIDTRILDSQTVDRQIFLDGVVQSRRYGERAYHEALVHPAMLMHPNPERVAIVGAGEGATLREVLKHNTIKQVFMIEIDPDVMSLSRQHLPEWNDCSDLILPEGMVNPTGNCFDDPRAIVYAKDAIRWFMEHFPENGTTTEDLFDVIIMDALDPGDKVEFSDMLFDNTELVATFHRALTKDGIFGCQMGDQMFLEDPNPMQTRDRHSVIFVQNLGKVGFQRLLDYNEPSTRFGGLWSFLLASKASGAERWFANPAEIDFELHKRAMPTKSGAWPFHYYDGATHKSYHVTHRSYAEVMCRGTPDTRDCQRGPGLVGSVNIPVDEAISLQDGVVVANRDLDSGIYVGLEECVHQTWDIPHHAKTLIDSLVEASIATHLSIWKKLTMMFGSPAPLLGLKSETVDMGKDTWMKGCRLSDALSERGEPGVSSPMLGRFWRIYECAARRKLHESVTAGSRMDCAKE